MLVIALILAVLAAILHVLIFFLESLAWTGPRARKVFGTTPEEAAATREMAFNHGFYTFFRCLVAGPGVEVSIRNRTPWDGTAARMMAGSEEEEDPFDAGLTMLVNDAGEVHWLQPGEDPADYQ